MCEKPSDKIQLIGQQLAAKRGQNHLFSGLDFTAYGGEMIMLTGPNGCGKSTLLRIIAGLFTSIHGTVTFKSGSHFDAPQAYCHYLASQNAMKPSLTVADNLAFWLQFYDRQSSAPSNLSSTPSNLSFTPSNLSSTPSNVKHSIEHLDGRSAICRRKNQPQRLVIALQKLKLQTVAQLPYAVLSTGQQRRVAMARLLLSYRPIWLLDEPTAGLDLATSTLFSQLMQSHLAHGGIIVAATHLPLGITPAHPIALQDFAPTWPTTWSPPL